jgi:hypothetical protein
VLSPLRYAEEGPVGGAKSLSLRGPVGGESLRRGGDRSRSRLKSRPLSLSRTGNGERGANTAGLPSTSAARLGWIGGGDDRREVAAESLPDASLELNAGFAGEGDLRLLHVSAAGGSGRSRLNDGERRR